MSTSGDEWAKFFEATLAEQEDLKGSLEARANSVITSTGAIVTVLFALAAVVTGLEGFVPSDLTRWLLVGALGAFVLAVLFAVTIQRPSRYKRVSDSGMERLVSDTAYWSGHPAIAQRRIAEVRMDQVRTASGKNRSKARLLLLALAAQAVGVIALAVALVAEIWPEDEASLAALTASEEVWCTNHPVAVMLAADALGVIPDGVIPEDLYFTPGEDETTEVATAIARLRSSSAIAALFPSTQTGEWFFDPGIDRSNVALDLANAGLATIGAFDSWVDDAVGSDVAWSSVWATTPFGESCGAAVRAAE